MNIAVILGAGKGSRMGGGDLPKQFLDISNKPVIIHTAMRFMFHKNIDKIILAVPADRVDYTKELVKKFIEKDTDKFVICSGGETRTDTILNSIKEAKKLCKDVSKIKLITHDAARPFTSFEAIRGNIELLDKYRVVDTVSAATDTIIKSNDGKIINEIPERKTMFQGQTPQSFYLKDFEDIFNTLTKEEVAKFTDACGMFVYKGIEVGIVKGSSSNIKITTPFDFRLARALVELDPYDK